ncbi:plastocyanin/azurin family copper-binding protein [Acidihalobacter aeolianus]|uniref:plastocyanin/azurin family copper-binding protein n=1 Tax=Acidihalobacter aeolianus TaxID=2792603 RepID=UPI0012EAD5DB|nr:plastocyanin/azurin family copper-binding protein [Acidihalobacter aeolianus]
MTADFGKRAEIGHDQTKWPVTLIRNGRSRSSEMTGHVAPKYALPGFPYPSFEVDNQKNPTLVFTHGANITFYVINTSQVAPHSFAITSAAPPYAIVPADHRVSHPQVNTGDLPILPQSGRYSYAKVTWTAPNPGSYYYLCMFPVHASFGMWGKIQVR